MIDAGDAVCSVYYVGTPYTRTKVESEARLRRSAASHAAVEKIALGKLSKLTAPSFMEPAWRQFIAYRRTLIKDWLFVAKRGLRDGNRNILASIHATQESMLATARREGFRECQEFG